MEFKKGEKLPLHPNLNKIHQAQNFWMMSYKVDANYVDGKDAKGNPIISRFSCEEATDFKERKNRTSPRNYIGNIVNSYTSVVFRNAVEREEALDEFSANVDGKGTSLSDSMKKSTLNTLINGLCPIIYESEVAGSTLSMAQSRLSGQDRLIVADPKSLLNWTMVDDFLLDALISFVDENGKTFARYYTNETVQDIYFDAKTWNIQSVGEPKEHGLSNIPVYINKIDVAYDSFVSPLAENQKMIANYQSLVATELYEQTFTRWLIAGVEQPQNDGESKPTITMGSKRLMTTSETGVGVHRLASDITQAASIRQQIIDEELNLFRTAGMAHDDIAANASGSARILAKDQFYVIANLITQSIEKAENYFLRIISSQRGIEIAPSYYSRSYEEPDWQGRITELRDILALDLPEEIKKKAIEAFQKDFF